MNIVGHLTTHTATLTDYFNNCPSYSLCVIPLLWQLLSAAHLRLDARLFKGPGQLYEVSHQRSCFYSDGGMLSIRCMYVHVCQLFH